MYDTDVLDRKAAIPTAVALGASSGRSRRIREPGSYELRGQATMTAAEWIGITDNPRQRDTERRLRRALHLDQFDPVHANVIMAVLPDGQRYKVDGHTRAAKWAADDRIAPPTVNAQVWLCADLTAVCKLYERIDSAEAVETASDKLFGSAKQAGIEFRSAMLRRGQYGSALKIVYGFTVRGNVSNHNKGISLDEAVRFYGDELILLDSIGPTTTKFSSGIIMAALATLKTRSRSALPFWMAYQNGTGSKDRGDMDGVQALTELFLKTRTAKRDYTTTVWGLFYGGVSHYLKWEKSRRIQNVHSALKQAEILSFCRRSFEANRVL